MPNTLMRTKRFSIGNCGVYFRASDRKFRSWMNRKLKECRLVPFFHSPKFDGINFTPKSATPERWHWRMARGSVAMTNEREIPADFALRKNGNKFKNVREVHRIEWSCLFWHSQLTTSNQNIWNEAGKKSTTLGRMAFGVMINRRQLVSEIAAEKTKMCLMIRIEVIRHFLSTCICVYVCHGGGRWKVHKRRTEY